MITIKETLTFLWLLFFVTNLNAQSDAQYAVRFNLNSFDCINGEVYVDLEVSAVPGLSRFFIAEQNYRFSFDDNVVTNPRISEELEISGTLIGSEHTAFFDLHNLNGSLDTIVSYNVVLGGGTGYPVDDTRWYPVGRIVFDIVDPGGCFELKWHTKAPEDFPPTTITEKIGGVAGDLFAVAEGTYDNGGTNGPSNPNALSCDLACLPIELASFEVFDRGCKTELKWVTLTETDNEYFLIEKSIDGVRWNTIGKIPGAGTSLEPIEYFFLDENINSLVTYYRLKQVDFDGASASSSSRTLRSSCFNDQISVGITELFPNPVLGEERVTVEFYTDRNEDAELVVTDDLGRVVKKFAYSMTDGRNTLSFKADFLAAGIYFVQVKGKGWFSRVQKLIKLGA